MVYKTFLTVFFALLPVFGSAQGVAYTPSKAQADGQKAASEIGASGRYNPQSLMAIPGAQGSQVFGDRYNSNATKNLQSELKSTSSNENLKNFGQTAQESSVSKIKDNSVKGGDFYSNNIETQSDEASYFLVTGQKGDPHSSQSALRTGAFNVQSIKREEAAAGTGEKPFAQAGGLITGMGSSSTMQCSSNETTFAANAQTNTCTSMYQPHDTWCKQNLELKINGEEVNSQVIGKQSISMIREGDILGSRKLLEYHTGKINWNMSSKWSPSDSATLWSNMLTLKTVNLSLGDFYELKLNGKTIIRNNPTVVQNSRTLIGGYMKDVSPFTYPNNFFPPATSWGGINRIFVDADNNEFPYFGRVNPLCPTNPGCEGILPDLDLTNYVKDGTNTLSFACFSINDGPRLCNIELLLTGKSTNYSAAWTPSGSCSQIDKLNKPIE